MTQPTQLKLHVKNDIPDISQSLPQLKKDAANAIIDNLDWCGQDWAWHTDSYSMIIHKPSQTKLSVYCGSMEIYEPHKVKFGWINWFRLRQAFKRWRRRSGVKQKTQSEKSALVVVIDKLS